MTLLAVEGLTKAYGGPRGMRALDGVSLSVARGETLGLVGPSGSGKSTLARVVMRLIAPDEGTVRFAGADWLSLRGAALRRARAGMQMVFQDPQAAFHPRARVGDAVGEALRIHRIGTRGDRAARVGALLARVGLAPDLAPRAVAELSGGQRQRVAIARALAPGPALVVLDEAVSALDVTVRGRILDLLVSLQREAGLAYLFVSHDLSVVRAVAHRVAIMDRGRIVETGPTQAVIAAPASATGRALVAAVPRLLARPLAEDTSP